MGALPFMILIDGKKISSQIQKEFSDFVNSLTDRKPCLAVILVGNNPASEIYISKKTKACEEIGIDSKKFCLPEETSEEQLLHHIDSLNKNPEIDGILVQLPLPKHINPTTITIGISPEKDVDGLHPLNLGKLSLEHDSTGFVPCTPLGIKVLLEKHYIDTTGKHAVIVGRSTIVGKPMASLLLQKEKYGNATVTVAHGQSKNLSEICLQADILISAVGKPLLIKEEMVKSGVVVIDVGINRISDPNKASGHKLVGDVDYKNVKKKCSYITPVPGGVGPMTIAMLMNNTIKSYCRRQSIKKAVKCPDIFY